MPTPRGTLPAGFEDSAARASSSGGATLADSLRRLGAHLADGATLSFDDEARAREVAATLERAPHLGLPSAALAASTPLAHLGDTEMANNTLVRLFRARRETKDVSLLMSEALLEAMAVAAVAFDEHAEVLGWTFATPAPAERTRWAARLAAASENVGLETTGGWLAMASAAMPDDDAFRSLVEEAYAAAGIGSCAGAALARLSRA